MPVTNYMWDAVSDNVLMESDENGATVAEYTNEPDEFGQLISQRRDSTSTYHFDGQGSTRQLTDADGAVTDTATYSAFGETVASSGTTENPFGYNGNVGYYASPTADDHYVRERVYVNQLGRWLSTDPMDFTDGINWYSYVANNPVDHVDPSGLLTAISCPVRCSGKVIGKLDNSNVGYHDTGTVVGNSTRPIARWPANGIRFSIWFYAKPVGRVPPCCCDSYDLVQWVRTSVKVGTKGPGLDLDGPQVFQGPHTVPAGRPPHSVNLFPGYPGTMNSTAALYDAPMYPFPKGAPGTVKMEFVTCVLCVRKDGMGPTRSTIDDLLSQCVFNAFSVTKGRGVVRTGPRCSGPVGQEYLDVLAAKRSWTEQVDFQADWKRKFNPPKCGVSGAGSSTTPPQEEC